jgi:hypothetical protein
MTRARLANRRAAETFELEVAGLHYTCTVGRFADGRLGEIFLSNGRAGSHADAAARDSAVVCSIALQHGVPVEVIRKALMRDARGNPETPLAAALDAIAFRSRWRLPFPWHRVAPLSTVSSQLVALPLSASPRHFLEDSEEEKTSVASAARGRRVWIVMLDGQRHTFPTNEAAWRWLDRQERRTPWRTAFYSI